MFRVLGVRHAGGSRSLFVLQRGAHDLPGRRLSPHAAAAALNPAHSPPSFRLRLPAQPTSMTVGHGYVAAGGQNSQLDVRRLAGGDIVYKGELAVLFFPASLLPRSCWLFLCWLVAADARARMPCPALLCMCTCTCSLCPLPSHLTPPDPTHNPKPSRPLRRVGEQRATHRSRRLAPGRWGLLAGCGSSAMHAALRSCPASGPASTAAACLYAS